MQTSDVIKILQAKQGEQSLRQFAGKVGCTAAYLSDLYRGNRQPGKKIMKFLGLKKTRTVETSYAKAR